VNRESNVTLGLSGSSLRNGNRLRIWMACEHKIHVRKVWYFFQKKATPRLAINPRGDIANFDMVV